jgi:CubicO group peptidase (beta-lactamase class C family)
MRSGLYLLVFTFSVHVNLFSQPNPSAETAVKIKQVENGLFERLLINGKTYSLQERMKYHKVNGVSIAVIDNYQIVWSKGYGYADVEEKRKVDTHTFFQANSMSKAINALGILKLAQEGKIDLYKDVNEQLKSWAFRYDSTTWPKITPAHLLSHTAGLPFWGYGSINSTDTIYSTLDYLNGHPKTGAPLLQPVSPAGKMGDYSNAGALVLQQLYTDITGKEYSAAIAAQVLQPLGMHTSFFTTPPPGNLSPKLASGYLASGERVNNKFMLSAIMATGGLWTTPGEFANYVVEMQLAYKGKSNKVINQPMAQLHLTRTLADADVSPGSWIQNRKEELYFFHSGSNVGTTCWFLAGVHNGKGLVVMCNSDNTAVLTELMNSIANVYNWEGWDKPQHIQTKTLPDKTLSQYAGYYMVDSTLLEIAKEKNDLFLHVNWQKSKIHFTTTTDFLNMEFPSEKTFVINKQGHVEGYLRKFNGKEVLVKKITAMNAVALKKGEYSSYSQYLLREKKFEQAIRLLQTGLIKEPTDSSIKRYLAHAYLFAANYNKAMEIYQTLPLSTPEEKTTLKEELLFFKNRGFNEKGIMKALQTLKL